MSGAQYVCAFRKGQHRSAAWQAQRGHRMFHVEAGDLVHAVLIPNDTKEPHFEALAETLRVAPGATPHAVQPICADLIDIIK